MLEQFVSRISYDGHKSLSRNEVAMVALNVSAPCLQ